VPTEESGDQTRTSRPINGMWEHREKLKQHRSLLLIIPMEHRNSSNMEDEKRWETFYMYQTTEA